jgi:hydroxyethylthiazole kinase-like uncharacterized protein yjeF
LYGVVETRHIEQHALTSLPPNTLMQRAGLATARLALAIAPHANRIWIACGPGNNGGDGLETALHLHHWGKQVVITWLGVPNCMPPDTAAAFQRVIDAKIPVANEITGELDLIIDALLGIGTQSREPQGLMADWINRINAAQTPVLSIDVPSGLDATTGKATQLHVKATHTLSLLTLKPGLFTSQGRDAAGEVWLDTLGVDASRTNFLAPTAQLLREPVALLRLHTSHKGSYGDVAIIGGAPGMTGAALLAASAALHMGAGRVFVHLLDGGSLTANTHQPELMFRSISALDFSSMTLVCGCGGGDAVHAILPKVLSASAPIVIDADAINSIANDTHLQKALTSRSHEHAFTVLTPHPLEAARLLGLSTAAVQNNRLAAAQDLSTRFGCTIVLKGSGTVIASPGCTSMINPTANARLATAGTGDVLAGMVGTLLASGMTAFDAACHAVYRHGLLADEWSNTQALTASRLAQTNMAAASK